MEAATGTIETGERGGTRRTAKLEMGGRGMSG